MEDLRLLLKDDEARIAPEALGYILRGLNAVVHDLVQDGAPDDAAEQARHREMLHAVAYCAQLFSAMLARWLGEHIDSCDPRTPE